MSASSLVEDSRARLRELLRARLGTRGTWFPLSHGQEALWFLWKLAPQSCAYNIVVPIGIRGNLDVPTLRKSLQILWDRHSSLRTAFREDDGKPTQAVIEDSTARIAEIDA